MVLEMAKHSCTHQVLQLVFPDEVAPDSSSAKRSQTTGKLLITMPKAKTMLRKQPTKPTSKPGTRSSTAGVQFNVDRSTSPTHISKVSKDTPLLLEVDPTVHRKDADIANIIKDKGKEENGLSDVNMTASERGKSLVTVISSGAKEPPPDFVDDPDVPPLI